MCSKLVSLPRKYLEHLKKKNQENLTYSFCIFVNVQIS